MKTAASREQIDLVNARLQNADVALGEPRGRSTPLLKLLFAPGWVRFDEQVVNTELLDEAHRFFTGAGADREHADDRTDAEDNAERGENRTRFLAPEILSRKNQVRCVAGRVHVCGFIWGDSAWRSSVRGSSSC